MARRPKPWYRRARQAWFVTLDGVQHNLGPRKKEAYERFYELMRHPRRRRVPAHSLVAIIDEFLEWVQRHRSPHSYEAYRYRLQRFIERYPDLRLTELRPHHVEKWADSYELAQTTRRNYFRAVKRCMKWAKKQGYVDENPIEYLEVPSAESREVVVRPAEFGNLLTYVRDESFEDLLVTAWETGCRPQELLRVTANHVDVSCQRWVFKRSESKMKQITRVVYLSDKAFAITRRLMLKHPTGPLYRNTKGGPWKVSAVNCGFTRLRIRMGLEEMERRREVIAESEIVALATKLSKNKTVNGRLVTKSKAELRFEAKRKLRYSRAKELASKWCLYALRHSWATNALENGIDALPGPRAVSAGSTADARPTPTPRSDSKRSWTVPIR